MKVFDIEADGLLPSVSKVHCIVVKDTRTHEVRQYHGESVVDGVRALENAAKSGERIAGHNIIKYDVPVLQRLLGFSVPESALVDSLVLARLMFSDVDRLIDAGLIARNASRERFPPALRGKQSLEAWGWRLGVHKGAFESKTESKWDTFTPAMLEYCVQDVEVEHVLLSFLTRSPYSRLAISFEHEAAIACARMERSGWPFDVDGGTSLADQLRAERDSIGGQLALAFPAEPRANGKTTKLVAFNPGSRQQIVERLSRKYRWRPTKFTEKGTAKIDDAVLEALDFPEARLLARHAMLTKRLSQLADGGESWLKLVRHGHIHGSINTNGAVTGRCTHSRPNVAQVPSKHTPYGPECRALFTVRPGFKALGADLAGLELRCLAHFVYAWDQGRYVRTILTGDVHTMNQRAAGLPTRDTAKTFIYAFLYGAGDERIGSIIGGDKAAGARLKRTFLSRTPALRHLKADVALRSAGGFLTGLDGRLVPVRSAHSALNTLLQSAGALISKRWVVECFKQADRRGWRYGWDGDFTMLGYIHDEIQWAVVAHLVDDFGRMVTDAAVRAGDYFKFKCPIAAEYKVGANWSETH